MKIAKRQWLGADGKTRTAWRVDYVYRAGARSRKQFSTRRGAEAFAATLGARLASTPSVVAAQRMSVADLAADWLAACEVRQQRGQRMEAATLREYRRHVASRILGPDGLGTLKLADVSRREVRSFRDRLLAGGMSVAMARKILCTLKLLLGFAVDGDLIQANPAAGCEVITDSRIDDRIAVPSRDDVRRLIEAAPDDFRAFVAVAAFAGLRLSEQRALTWGAVDLAGGWIEVRQRADRFNVIGQPKSAAGARRVPIGPYVVNLLRAWRGDRVPAAGDLVFPSRSGKVQSHGNIANRRWYPLLAATGLDLRWHDLRHFCVSSWLAEGFGLTAVMEFAGHSSYQMTMERYGHLLPADDHRDKIARAEGLVFGGTRTAHDGASR